jgi:arsenate reductase
MTVLNGTAFLDATPQHKGLKQQGSGVSAHFESKKRSEMTRHKPKVLFLSTGNATRSLIAEGFLRKLTGERFDVTSVGVERSASNPLANEVMKEAGIDISGQKTKSIAESLKEPFGHVITICDTTKEKNPVFPFALGVLHWNILDPNSAGGLMEQKKEVFRRVRDDVQEKVEQFVADTAQMESSELSIA